MVKGVGGDSMAYTCNSRQCCEGPYRPYKNHGINPERSGVSVGEAGRAWFRSQNHFPGLKQLRFISCCCVSITGHCGRGEGACPSSWM